jgi:hypothetical protein
MANFIAKHLCMKYILLMLPVMVCLAACQKDDEPITLPPVVSQPLTDFALIPVKDATWEVVTQGKFINGTVDMTKFYHTTITCSGKDTQALGLRYFRYNYTNENGAGVLYIREDTMRQKLYALAPGFIAPEGVVVDYGYDEVGDEASVPQQWPASMVASVDSAVINKQYLKKWNLSYSYDKSKKFFYRAYGIGGQTGIIPSIFIAQGTQPVSVSFSYKGETLKYEFEVH